MPRSILFIVSLCFTLATQALIFELPPRGQDIIGQVQYFAAEQGDTLRAIGMAYDVGRNPMKVNNPLFDPDQPLPVGVPVVVPSRFILPPYAHKGIVVNLSTMRIFYYPPGTNLVMTYPIGIGKPGFMTPLGITYVTRKIVNPSWTPPDSIREFNRQKGILLPRVIHGGADNPLGSRAIYLAIPQYLIHATNFPESIGSRGSFGCMRMMETDIDQLFPWVATNTQVRVIEEPYLAGWSNGQLYLEIHKPLDENTFALYKNMAPVLQSLVQLALQHHVEINWTKVQWAFINASGIPTEVSDSAANEDEMEFAPATLSWPSTTTLCRLSGNCYLNSYA